MENMQMTMEHLDEVSKMLPNANHIKLLRNCQCNVKLHVITISVNVERVM